MNLDSEEQSMMDDFLRMTGGSAFKFGGGRRKKGRSSKPSKGMRAAEMEEAMMMESLMQMMSSAIPEPKCPKGHGLKRRKANGEYECDNCGADIAEGKRIFECKKCDFSLCKTCYETKKDELL